MPKMNTIELQEALKKLGVKLTGEESYKDLVALYADEQTKNADPAADEDEADQDDEDTVDEDEADDESTSNTAPTGNLFVWLKNKAYVDEAGKQRMQSGLFQMESLDKYPRLKKLGKDSVEIFEGEIPSMKLAQIAKWSGVNPDKYRKDAELLEVLLAEPTVY